MPITRCLILDWDPNAWRTRNSTSNHWEPSECCVPCVSCLVSQVRFSFLLSSTFSLSCIPQQISTGWIEWYCQKTTIRRKSEFGLHIFKIANNSWRTKRHTAAIGCASGWESRTLFSCGSFKISILEQPQMRATRTVGELELEPYDRFNYGFHLAKSARRRPRTNSHPKRWGDIAVRVFARQTSVARSSPGDASPRNAGTGDPRSHSTSSSTTCIQC